LTQTTTKTLLPARMSYQSYGTFLARCSRLNLREIANRENQARFNFSMSSTMPTPIILTPPHFPTTGTGCTSRATTGSEPAHYHGARTWRLHSSRGRAPSLTWHLHEHCGEACSTSNGHASRYVSDEQCETSNANSRPFSLSGTLAIYMKMYLYPVTQEVLHGLAVSRARCPKLQREFGPALSENRCVSIPI